MNEKERKIYNSAFNDLNSNITIPITVEYLFSSIFGAQKYHGMVGSAKLGYWKKELKKLLLHLRKFVINNINSTDKLHYDELNESFDLALKNIKGSKTSNEVNMSMIVFLVKLNFLLLGKYPNNFFESTIRNKKHLWRLDRYRKVFYSQSYEQKFNVIIDKYRNRGSEGLSGLKKSFEDELYEKLREFKWDYFSFIVWFRQEHREKYEELFL